MTRRERDRIALLVLLAIALFAAVYAKSVYREAAAADKLKPTTTARIAHPKEKP